MSALLTSWEAEKHALAVALDSLPEQQGKLV